MKIFDSNKNYGIRRIKSGLTQTIKYSNDYNKNVGYLVIFNMDDYEISFSFSDKTHSGLPFLHINNKIYYFIVINCFPSETASKLGVLRNIEISESELRTKQ